MKKGSSILGFGLCFVLATMTISCGSAMHASHPRAAQYVQSNNATLDMDCKTICGPGFHYDRSGDKMGGREKICTWYPYDCGYACTKGWDLEYLKDGTDYTCQTAKQNVPRTEHEEPAYQDPASEKEMRDMDCKNICDYLGWPFATLIYLFAVLAISIAIKYLLGKFSRYIIGL